MRAASGSADCCTAGGTCGASCLSPRLCQSCAPPICAPSPYQHHPLVRVRVHHHPLVRVRVQHRGAAASSKPGQRRRRQQPRRRLLSGGWVDGWVVRQQVGFGMGCRVGGRRATRCATRAGHPVPTPPPCLFNCRLCAALPASPTSSQLAPCPGTRPLPPAPAGGQLARQAGAARPRRQRARRPPLPPLAFDAAAAAVGAWGGGPPARPPARPIMCRSADRRMPWVPPFGASCLPCVPAARQLRSGRAQRSRLAVGRRSQLGAAAAAAAAAGSLCRLVEAWEASDLLLALPGTRPHLPLPSFLVPAPCSCRHAASNGRAAPPRCTAQATTFGS